MRLYVAELKKLGFRVWGFNGLKMLWKVNKGRAVVKSTPQTILSTLLIDITELFVYHYPSLAFQLFFIKDIRNEHQERFQL